MLAILSKKLKYVFVLVLAGFSFVWFVEGFADVAIDTAQSPLKKVELIVSEDLVADGQKAGEKQVPVLMMFSMTHCGYCIEVEEDFLKPMLRNSEYNGKVLIRKIKIDGDKVLRDFNGNVRDPNEFSDDYNVSMVPTLVLVDSRGKQLVSSIIGLANPHYYGGELDDAIDVSVQKIRAIAKR